MVQPTAKGPISTTTARECGPDRDDLCPTCFGRNAGGGTEAFEPAEEPLGRVRALG
jgi:hypothetical protein